MRAGREKPFARHHFLAEMIFGPLALAAALLPSHVMHVARAWPGGAMEMPDAHAEPHALLTAMRSPRISAQVSAAA